MLLHPVPAMGTVKVIETVLLITAAVALAACRGPRPAIVSRQLLPPESPAAPYIALVTIRNTGGGEGQVEAIARLRSAVQGQTVAEAARQIDLSPFETVQVRFELRAPAAGHYELVTDAKYPP